MSERPPDERPEAGPRPARLPAWPLGCALSLVNLLLICNLYGMIGVMLSPMRLPLWQAMALPLVAVAPVPLAELAGAIWLRRRNPYAARALAWGLVATLALGGLLFLGTEWLNRASGL